MQTSYIFIRLCVIREVRSVCCESILKELVQCFRLPQRFESEVPFFVFFFRGKLTVFLQPEDEIALASKRLNVET